MASCQMAGQIVQRQSFRMSVIEIWQELLLNKEVIGDFLHPRSHRFRSFLQLSCSTMRKTHNLYGSDISKKSYLWFQFR